MSKNKQKFYFTLSEMGDFLAKFSEHSEQVYWISSPDFSKIQYVSPSYEKIWGRSRDELYNSPQKWLSFFHPDDAIEHNPIEKMADDIRLYGDQARYAANYRIVRPDGEIRWIKDSGFPLIDSEGICYGVAGVAIDVTEEYRNTEQLKIAKEKAEAANQAKDEFIRNMSHDIRTPLSGIIGMSSILEKEAHTLEEKEHAHMVNISGEQLLSLLNSVLDIIASGSQAENQLNLSAVNLGNLIQNIAQLELPTIKVKNLDLVIKLAEELPEFVETDAVKVHRILLNLLGNAVKFTEKGAIEIGVNLNHNDNNNPMIEFYIKDSGGGITEKDQKNIFKKFYRGTSSYQGLHAGHGVGLYIVKKYTRLLKGKISIESILNEGTTFTLSIPVNILKSASAALPPPLPSVRDKINNTNPGSKIQVLLIEDNIIALKTAENILRQMGIDFQSAADGAKAIELFSQGCFQMVLSDIGLPDISGLEVTGHFRALEKKLGSSPVPIIGLTAHSILETEQEALQAGMNRLLSKPLRPEHITQLINLYNICPPRETDHSLAFETDKQSMARGDLGENESDLFKLERFVLFDKEEGMNYSGGLESLKELLALFITSELPLDKKKMQNAFENKNYLGVEKYAHKIKGGAVYVGTIRMRYACQYVERYLKTGQRELVEALYHQAVSTIEETLTHIEDWLKNQASVE